MHPKLDTPATYRICAHGYLEPSWSDRLGGLDIKSIGEEDGDLVTTLEGQIIDQAALFGVLKALYDMRLPLISVECLAAH